MKILNSISNIYNEIYPEAALLQKAVGDIISSFKADNWHYFHRIKAPESFALKLETGRVSDPKKLEDFFAATLVVQNLSELNSALKKIEELFIVEYRRPKFENITHKDSSAFPFDDLRLYLKIKPIEYLPPSTLNDYIFELQIKTFLQHAWSISTHDLIYKSDNISWAKERVAFQIRAMLEQAEIAISGAENLSSLPELDKTNKETQMLNDIRTFLKKNFTKESLPSDILRLSKIVNDLLFNFKITLIELQTILDLETTNGRGVKTLDLSPYSIIIDSIKNTNIAKFENAFKVNSKLKNKNIFVPKEIAILGLTIEDRSKMLST